MYEVKSISRFAHQLRETTTGQFLGTFTTQAAAQAEASRINAARRYRQTKRITDWQRYLEARIASMEGTK